MSLTDVFINLFSGIIQAVFSVLPTAPSPVLPAQLTDGLSYLVTSASAWNKVFPLTTAFIVIIFIMTFETIFWGFKLGVFIYDKIRGS